MEKGKKRIQNKQLAQFKIVARELGCDETDDSFNQVLGKIGRAVPAPKAPAKKRKPLKIALPDA